MFLQSSMNALLSSALADEWLSEAGIADDDREHDDEREWDPAEHGIADLDGALEQWPGIYGSVR